MIRVQSLFIIHPFHSVLRCATILHAVRHSAHPVLSSKQGKHLQHPYQCTQNTTQSNKFNLILFECWVSIEAKEIAIGNRTLSAHTIDKQKNKNKTGISPLTAHLQTRLQGGSASFRARYSPCPALPTSTGKNDP